MKAKLRSNIGKIEESLAESFFQRRSNIKPPENLKPGDSVLILDLNRKGTVITPPDRDGEALVQAGIMKINVHVSNLKLVDEQSLEIRRTGSAAIGMSKAMSISPQIDIRGMNVEEAVTALGKFLDDAAIAGLSEVTIVHGRAPVPSETESICILRLTTMSKATGSGNMARVSRSDHRHAEMTFRYYANLSKISKFVLNIVGINNIMLIASLCHNMAGKSIASGCLY